MSIIKIEMFPWSSIIFIENELKSTNYLPLGRTQPSLRVHFPTNLAASESWW